MFLGGLGRLSDQEILALPSRKGTLELGYIAASNPIIGYVGRVTGQIGDQYYSPMAFWSSGEGTEYVLNPAKYVAVNIPGAAPPYNLWVAPIELTVGAVAPVPVYVAPAPAPAPVYVAPAPAPVYVAPAPAPVYVAPAPAPAPEPLMTTMTVIEAPVVAPTPSTPALQPVVVSPPTQITSRQTAVPQSAFTASFQSSSGIPIETGFAPPVEELVAGAPVDWSTYAGPSWGDFSYMDMRETDTFREGPLQLEPLALEPLKTGPSTWWPLALLIAGVTIAASRKKRV